MRKEEQIYSDNLFHTTLEMVLKTDLGKQLYGKYSNGGNEKVMSYRDYQQFLKDNNDKNFMSYKKGDLLLFILDNKTTMIKDANAVYEGAEVPAPYARTKPDIGFGTMNIGKERDIPVYTIPDIDKIITLQGIMPKVTDDSPIRQNWRFHTIVCYMAYWAIEPKRGEISVPKGYSFLSKEQDNTNTLYHELKYHIDLSPSRDYGLNSTQAHKLSGWIDKIGVSATSLEYKNNELSSELILNGTSHPNYKNDFKTLKLDDLLGDKRFKNQTKQDEYEDNEAQKEVAKDFFVYDYYKANKESLAQFIACYEGLDKKLSPNNAEEQDLIWEMLQSEGEFAFCEQIKKV